MVHVRYNERSWAIDVISAINAFVLNSDRKIKRAGGENTIIGNLNSLFPDILLFDNTTTGNILQGWELKMPDTSITDGEFIEKATEKARVLGLNSFLLWNVSIAVLYIKGDDDCFYPRKNWADLQHISSRTQVEGARTEWTTVLHNIISDLNDFFNEGLLQSKTVIESLYDRGIIDLLLVNSSGVAQQLRLESASDSVFDAEVDSWWRSAGVEYPEDDDRWVVLSKIILISWINKLVFAHILKPYYSSASDVDRIDETISITESIEIFNSISNVCDFWYVFRPKLGEDLLTAEAFNGLCQLNGFLKEIKLENIDQAVLQDFLSSTIFAIKRKAAGQFVTPIALAELVVRLTVDDKAKLVWDPCCGTGTIARAAYDIKKEYGISCSDAIASVWASDKFSFPLHVATLALTEPDNIREIINIFREDITEASVDKEISFCNPDNGEIVHKNFPSMDYIVSNLPFVQQEDLNILNPNVNQVNDRIQEYTGNAISLDGRSDLYGYIPFYLWNLLSEGGRLGLIVSNSWLGTDWGIKFRSILRDYYNIEYIIISACGRWFDETKVVTTILILKKKGSIHTNNTVSTSFVSLDKKLIEFEGGSNEISSTILTRNSDYESITINSYTPDNIEYFDNINIGWNALFSDLNWLIDINNVLLPAKNLFEINRGERRGWDPMFYPTEGHGIEDIYLKTVLKSPYNINSLIATSDAQAFCCSESMETLESNNHHGALSWIRRFEQEVNQVGIPLPKSLRRTGVHWYQMSASTIADLVMSVNYDKRLFIAKLSQRSFVNQRLVRFTVKNSELDVDLCHALLNSIFGLFYIEALGFGRGQGALDLNSRKIKRGLYMLNPTHLSNTQAITIKAKFAALLDRPPLPIQEEIRTEDRIEFDESVLSAFGIMDKCENIKDSLTRLYKIRTAVRI